MSADDFLAPFEELVLTAILEAGQGALEVSICRKVRPSEKAPQTDSLAKARLSVELLEGHTTYTDIPFAGAAYAQNFDTLAVNGANQS